MGYDTSWYIKLMGMLMSAIEEVWENNITPLLI